MSDSPAAQHRSTPDELRQRLEAERRGLPFIVFRDSQSRQRIVTLETTLERLTVGRTPESDLCLDWDEEVSRLHLELERVGEHWTAVDDGLSRNGTFVAGERVMGRRRLDDGDVVRAGSTSMLFRRPGAPGAATTRMSNERDVAVSLTDAQRRVLVALCRPFKDGAAFATPASNQEIAEDLVLTIAAVKTHLRTLWRKFGLEDLPQGEKRQRLVALAFAAGLVSDRDL